MFSRENTVDLQITRFALFSRENKTGLANTRPVNNCG